MDDLCSDIGTSSSQCSFAGADVRFDGLIDPYKGTISSQSDYGHLAANIQVEGSFNHYGLSTAMEFFSDELRIGGSGQGFIRFELTVDRNFATTGRGYDIYLAQDHFTTLACCDNSDNSGRIVYSSSLYPFDFASPFALSLISTSYVRIDQSELGFNYLDITLSGIKIYDGGMHAITAPITSKSGGIYSTPEPSSFIMLLTISTLVGVVRLIKSRRNA